MSLINLRTLTLFALLILPPTQASAAITADTSVQCTSVSSPITCSVTVAAGSNRAMFVPIGIGDNTTTISSITYNGVDIFGAAKYALTNGIVPTKAIGYCGIAPDTGTHDLVITFSAAPSGGGWTGPSVWQGVDQTTPCRAAMTTTENVGNTAISVTVSNAQNGDVVVDGVTSYTGGLTLGAGQTLLQRSNAPFGNPYDYATSYEAATGSTVMSWTAGSSGFYEIGGVALVPAAASGAAVRSLMMMGVGQ